MTRYLRSERGSIPLVLLAAIVMGGLLLVMFGNVRQSQRTVSMDRDFANAVQVADAGLQAAFMYIVNQDAGTLPGVGEVLRSDDLVQAEILQADSLVVGAGPFAWEAHRTGLQAWEIRASGTAGGSVRHLESSFGPRELFFTAMYGYEGLTGNFPGNVPSAANQSPDWHASSGFTSGINAYDSRNGLVVTDSNDIVAGTSDAGECDINPAPDDLDQILFGDGDLSGCQGRSEPLDEFPDVAQRAFEPGGVCNLDSPGPLPAGMTGPIPSYDSSSGGFVRGAVYCLQGEDRDLIFPPSHVAELVDGESSVEHVEVYIEGRIVMEGNGQSSRKHINVGTTATSPVPAAADLRLFFADQGEAINIANNNHVWLAAAIYAPLRTCQMGTQTIFYGAATCNEIVIQGGGGFRFYYDVATADILSDQVLILNGWREETGSTTGFTWTLTD